LGGALSATWHKLPPVLHVFGDESGSFHHDDYQVVGLLLCHEQDARRAELAQLRVDYNFYRELKYSDRDKFRLPFALAVIAWFFATPDLEFRCIVKKGSEVDLDYFANGWHGLPRETLAYNFTYKEVILNNRPATPHRLMVKIDERTRNQRDNLLDYLKAEIPSVQAVDEADSATDDLLQVVDLLTGCVYGACMTTTGAIQRGLVDTFLRGCGLSQIRGHQKVGRDKVNLWSWRGRKRATGSS
jgi:Protein of unknown function (DUF3800)